MSALHPRLLSAPAAGLFGGGRPRVAGGRRKGPKKAGANKGVWVEAPAGFGAAAPGPSPRRAIFFNRRAR
jgi:hypothetical protein